MQPSIGTASLNITWTDGDGHHEHVQGTPVAVPYRVAVSGTIPIPVGTAADTEVDCPLTGISKGVTCIMVENNTRQELKMAFGGNWAPSLPAGGKFMFAFPTVVSDAGSHITGVRFWLTEEQLVDSCGICYWGLGE